MPKSEEANMEDQLDIIRDGEQKDDGEWVPAWRTKKIQILKKINNIPSVEVVGQTCGKAQKRQKLVYGPDGKSRWYVDVEDDEQNV